MTTRKPNHIVGTVPTGMLTGLIEANDPELMIISPYISDYYTKMLLDKAKNKLVRIITSESSMSYKDAMLNRYLAQSTRGYVKAIAFFLILDLISIFLQFNYTTAILTAILFSIGTSCL